MVTVELDGKLLPYFASLNFIPLDILLKSLERKRELRLSLLVVLILILVFYLFESRDRYRLFTDV